MAGGGLALAALGDALDLWLTYSFTRGRLALPGLLDVKQAVIRGDELVRRRDQLSRLCESVGRRAMAVSATPKVARTPRQGAVGLHADFTSRS